MILIVNLIKRKPTLIPRKGFGGKMICKHRFHWYWCSKEDLWCSGRMTCEVRAGVWVFVQACRLPFVSRVANGEDVSLARTATRGTHRSCTEPYVLQDVFMLQWHCSRLANQRQWHIGAWHVEVLEVLGVGVGVIQLLSKKGCCGCAHANMEAYLCTVNCYTYCTILTKCSWACDVWPLVFTGRGVCCMLWPVTWKKSVH